VWPVGRFGTVGSPDIQDVGAAAAAPSAAAAAPYAVGLAGALPVAAWLRSRRD
jgi:signal peptidase I